MIRIFWLVLICLVTGVIALWAIKTGGTVSFQGEGWNFEVSLWAFVTSFLSGAGLLWIGVALCIWVIKSPLRVLGWLKTHRHKDKTATFLYDLEFLSQGMTAPVKKHLPYKNALLQSYLQLKITLVEKQWDKADIALKSLVTQAPFLGPWAHMTLEEARGDEAMALRYGLELYQQAGPVSFGHLLRWAEKTQRLEVLAPFMEEAYEKDPCWKIFRYLLPQWEKSGHIRKTLKHLSQLWQKEQHLDIFREICRLQNVPSPLERVQLLKKIQDNRPLSLEGNRTLHQILLEAELWGEAKELEKKLSLL